MTSRILIWALVLPLTLAPEPARSQCCTTPSGSGDHTRQGTSSERKMKKDIDRVLSSEKSRTLLMEALMQDRDFAEAFIGRIADHPQWRAVAQKRLATVSRDMSSASASRMATGRMEPLRADERAALPARTQLACQRTGVLAALEQGLATPEHAAFVARLGKQASNR